MDTIISFESIFNEKVDILFSSEHIKISVFSDNPEEYLIKYKDVRHFYIKEEGYRTSIEFYGDHFLLATIRKTTETTFCRIRLLNDNGNIDIANIFEDRTPLKTPQTKLKEMSIDFNYKYENSPKVYGNIYIQVSKVFDYEAIIDGVKPFRFYDMPYVDGCRVLTLPLNTWNIKVGGGTREDRWSTNETSISLTNFSPNIKLKVKTHWVSNPTLEKI